MIILRSFLLCLSLSLCMVSWSQTTQWRDIYKAKKKDTVFGIAKKYNISMVELMDANPEMKKEGYELKKGDMVFIPYEKTEEQKAEEAKKAAEAERLKLYGANDVRNRAIRIGVMLPLHNIDGDGRRMVEYYRGLLMACEALKAEGISTDIHAWNVPIDADIRQTLLEKDADNCDIIFGPLYTKQTNALSDFCRTYNIKMVIPFSIQGDAVLTNPNVFQVYQSPANLNDDAIKAFMERFPSHHPIFVDCNDSTSQKGVFTSGLRKQLDTKGVKYSITNLKSPDEAFARAFSATQPNIVILNTGRSPQLNSTLAKINTLIAANPNVNISLYGYTEWLMYTKVYNNYFHKYETYIPTTFYYNAESAKTQQLERNYKQWFKGDMMPALPRFAITGYDQANFFLRGLHQYGKDFRGTKDQNAYAHLQTPLNFKSTGVSGGMQNEAFMLVHYMKNGNIESINY